MRLTNIIRDAYVRAAMQDVPKIDYDEQAHKIALEAIAGKLAEIVPDEKARAQLSAEGWLDKCSVELPGSFSSLYTVAPSYTFLRNKLDVWDKLLALSALKKKQDQQRLDLERKLHAVAHSVTTRKALAAALPEFEKYLPADEPAAARNLPVVTNLIADFSKAGWPKSRGAQA